MNTPWWFIFYNVFFWIAAFWYALIGYKKYAYKTCGIYSTNPPPGLVIVFILIFMYSLFTFFGGDDERYAEFVRENYRKYEDVDYMPIERLYAYIAVFVNGNFLLWKSVVYGASLFFTYLTLRRFRCLNYITVLAFVVCAAQSYGATRAVLAYSLFLYGFSFFQSRKKLKWVFGVIVMISSLFAHTSMALPIILMPMMFVKITKRRLLLLALMYPIVVMGINILMQSIFGSSEIMEMTVGRKLNSYGREDDPGEHGAGNSLLLNIYMFLAYISILVLMYYSVKTDIKKMLPRGVSLMVREFFLVFYLSSAFAISTINSADVIAGRYISMIPFFLYITLPYIIHETTIIKRSRINLLMSVLCIVPIFYLFLITFYSYSGGR